MDMPKKHRSEGNEACRWCRAGQSRFLGWNPQKQSRRQEPGCTHCISGGSCKGGAWAGQGTDSQARMWSQDPVLAWPTGSGLESRRCAADHAPVLSGGRGPPLLFYPFYSVTILIVQKICKDSTENSHVSFNQSHQFKTFFHILILFLSSFLCLPLTHTLIHTQAHTHILFFFKLFGSSCCICCPQCCS